MLVLRESTINLIEESMKEPIKEQLTKILRKDYQPSCGLYMSVTFDFRRNSQCFCYVQLLQKPYKTLHARYTRASYQQVKPLMERSGRGFLCALLCAIRPQIVENQIQIYFNLISGLRYN